MNPKLLGISTKLYTKPLTESLRGNPSVQLVEESRPNLARQLREQELSASLLSPLEYAKESSDYCIVPKVAVVSAQTNGSIIIRFREGVNDIRSLAVDPAFAYEILLAKIVLAEEFDIEPLIYPMQGTVEAMLQKADAALLVGDQAFEELDKSEHIIDIVEEWNEMTGLPLVHAIWCGRENDLTEDEILLLQSSAEKGVAGIDDIAMAYPKEERDAVQSYLRSFSYELSDDAQDALAEFMRYLYYHGVQPDVAELNFYRKDDPEPGLLSDLSSN